VNQIHFKLKPLASLLLATALSACGGGGGSDTPGTSTQGGSTNTQTSGGTGGTGGTGATGTGTTGTGSTGTGSTGTGSAGTGSTGTGSTGTGGTQVPTTQSMVMSCVEGAGFQCSGSQRIKDENGVTLTDSGVQAYGISTSDLAASNPEKTTAYGMMLATGGLAEIRLAKNSGGATANPRMVLSNLNISWDGKVDRPPILETFSTAQSRITRDANGAIGALPLPAPTDYAYYDFVDKGPAATQANYANNVYFPRGSDNPPRCTGCQSVESTGARFQAGDWTAGGQNPHFLTAVRLHGDGDIHAGSGRPGPDGKPTILEGGSGTGVPFPGSKGYRGLDNWSFIHSNLSTWVTQDTVSIVEWTPGSDEHSTIRRGVVAFGDVTRPEVVPSTGTVTYAGIAYGWYANDRSGTPDNPQFFRAPATVTVNFATGQASVSLQNAFRDTAGMPALPNVNFSATASTGTGNARNYFTGTVNNGSMTGGVSGRYFGPVSAGAGGTGPAELGGAFSMQNTTTGAAVVGGFIALKK
jgi:hypothetical protein